MAGTSGAEAGHHSCHCIAAPKALRHPKARKYLPFPDLKPGLMIPCDAGRRFFSKARFSRVEDGPFGWRSGLPLRSKTSWNPPALAAEVPNRAQAQPGL